jgi:hypothetical protein
MKLWEKPYEALGKPLKLWEKPMKPSDSLIFLALEASEGFGAI